MVEYNVERKNLAKTLKVTPGKVRRSFINDWAPGNLTCFISMLYSTGAVLHYFICLTAVF